MDTETELLLSALPTKGGIATILRPSDMHSRPDIGLMIRNEADLLRAHAASCLRYGKPTPWRCADEVTAYITWGWWVFDCPRCRGGVSCGPDWSLACCFCCGAIFTAITFPPDPAGIEALLLDRPDVTTRNLHAELGEVVADLAAENLMMSDQLISSRVAP